MVLGGGFYLYGVTPSGTEHGVSTRRLAGDGSSGAWSLCHRSPASRSYRVCLSNSFVCVSWFLTARHPERQFV